MLMLRDPLAVCLVAQVCEWMLPAIQDGWMQVEGRDSDCPEISQVIAWFHQLMRAVISLVMGCLRDEGLLGKYAEEADVPKIPDPPIVMTVKTCLGCQAVHHQVSMTCLLRCIRKGSEQQDALTVTLDDHVYCLNDRRLNQI